jgi:choline dehydrogenase
MFANSVDEEYDYIVVGSGAGGGPVAANLAKAGYRVLVLEAGGSDEPIDYKVPAFHAQAAEHPAMAWNFYVKHYGGSERQRACEQVILDREKIKGPPPPGILYPRAGTLGGCTAHHAMIFVAPHNSDWEHIARLTGDRSWLPHRMRKYFRRVERCGYVGRPWSKWWDQSRHGFDGWLPTTIADATILLRDLVLSRLALSAIQVCLECRVLTSPGFPQIIKDWFFSFLDPSDWHRVGLARRSWSWLISLLDPNDWRRLKSEGEGPAVVPLTVKNGSRFGTRELLRAVAQTSPDNLTIKLHALVTRVILDDSKRAVGVEYLDGKNLYQASATKTSSDSAKEHRVRARHEVILAGGTFNTPQLLMLSGIGPAKELEELGIEVKVNLPGVGRNLQDRYEVGVIHKMKRDFAILEHATLKPEGPDFTEWQNGHGLYTTNGVILAIIKRSSHGRRDPDLFMFAIPGYFSGYWPGYSERGREKNYLTWAILKGHTKNTAGRVRLTSNDPRVAPDINFRYFDEGTDTGSDDLDAVVSGIEFIRTLGKRTAGLCDEILPGPSVQSRTELASFVRDNAWGHHACGTCRIGPTDDADAVVDSKFAVRGVKGLRIVDASIFPKIPGFFILSAIYMIAEKASDVIIADAR